MFLLTASASSGRLADTGPITTVHLAVIAVLIVLVIAAILWGARQKRARAEGERIEAERTEALLAHPQTETLRTEAQPVSAPVAPPPPPLGDAGVTATAPVAEPAPVPAPAPAAGRYGLTDVKGLGPKAIALLAGMGVGTLEDLAGLSADRAAEVDAGLGPLAGRLTRDRWVEQAALLTAGDVAAYEATYGKL
jgi:predicted flap endonuclease-1-like 5' DNA nuclease